MHSFVKIAVVGILSVAALPVYAAKSPLDNIENIVVLYGENRSFDNLYGLFPKANGIRNATQAQFQQIERL
jgi:phospholipase C